MEKISHFVFYIIRFILSGDTRLYKLYNKTSLSQSKIESTSSNFKTFNLCAFCIGILFGASAHLFTCNLHHRSPSSVALGHKLTAPLCYYSCLPWLSALQNIKQTNISSSTLHCNNPCVFTVYSPKCILYYTFLSIVFIRLLAVLWERDRIPCDSIKSKVWFRQWVCPDTWCLTQIEFRMSINADPNTSFSLSTWILKSPTIKTFFLNQH